MPTFGGNPVTLVGKQIRVNDTISDFVVIDNQLKEVHFNDYSKSPYRVISVVPSLDTGVCDTQTRKVNQELASIPGVVILTISNDLPFAQKRWCGQAGLDNVITLSDHKDLNFAKQFGTLVKELRLQTRAIFVVDQNGKVMYVEYLEELGNHPNYEALFDFMNQQVK